MPGGNAFSGTSLEEREQIVEDRTPHHAGKIVAPVLFLQGTLVFPSQTLQIGKKIVESGGDAEAVMFAGEGHGFRREDSIETSLEADDEGVKS